MQLEQLPILGKSVRRAVVLQDLETVDWQQLFTLHSLTSDQSQNSLELISARAQNDLWQYQMQN